MSEIGPGSADGRLVIALVPNTILEFLVTLRNGMAIMESLSLGVVISGLIEAIIMGFATDMIH